MTYTKDSLRQIFQQPFNAKEWQQMLQHFFRATELKSEPERIDGTPEDNQGFYLGAIDTTDSYRIGLFYYQIQHGNVARKRVGLRNLVKSFVNPNWGEFDAALAVFDSDSNIIVNSKFVNSKSLWRLSFVCDIKGENTAAKRFTYVFGENDNYYNTPVGRFDALQRNGISFENIKDAFSVERLNKDFFNGYKERYVKFLNHINEDTKENRDYVKKLLGRLVFLQFLQKKGWMGVPANQQGWNGGDKFYLNHLIERYEGNDRLLSDVLEPLFFNTLNERRINDLADSRLGENIKIPYLNGGLFDKDDLDKKDIDFPYDYFKELMDFFAMYNFTIDENDPEDSEIGIDPEMLGHIFENLLEDNKDKGAFYTPKEIVQYMSKESVAQYLKSKTPGELHTAIDSLIKQRVVEPVLQNKENARLVNRALSDVKVCDPAIGSGAFPMGVLNVLFDCRHLLYGFIGKNEVFSYAKVKRDIIQNNIYGVDIEKGAVDIARLRFWLALVVDENEPQPLPNLDFKIMQGNSLLEQYEDIDLSKLSDAGWSMKIVQPQADLFGHIDDPQLKLTFSSETHTLDLQNKITRYFSIDDHEEKIRLFHDIEEDVRQNILYNIEMRQRQAERIVEELKTYPTLDKKQLKEKAVKEEAIARYKEMMDDVQTMLFPNDKFFLWHTYYKDVFDQGGFDIVIGNPPYIQLEVDKGYLATMYESIGYETFDRKANIYCLFYERGWQLLRANGTLCYITLNKWMRADYGKPLRSFFTGKTNPKCLIDFGGIQLFENANVDTEILLFQKAINTHQLQYTDIKLKDIAKFSTLDDFVNTNHFSCKFEGNESWVMISDAKRAIKQKVEAKGLPLEKWDIQINYGVKTGFNNAFIISSEVRDEILAYCTDEKEKKRTNQIIRPILRGKDIKKYSNSWSKWLVYIPWHFPLHLDNEIQGASIEAEKQFSLQYPSVYHYLLNFKDKLSTRNRAETGIRYEWYAMQRWGAKYWREFDKHKIMYPNMTKYMPFYYDERGFFMNDKGFIITGKHISYLVAFFNSSLFKYCFIDDFPPLGEDRRELRKVYFDKIPVLEVNDSIDDEFRDLVLDIQNEYSDEKAKAIDGRIFDLYGLTQEERDTIGYIDFHNREDNSDEDD